MSLHIWVRKNLAAYLTGGLDAPERERLERHVARCAECARVLDVARSGDAMLAALFADVPPGPTLEDDLIRRLRKALPLAGMPRLSRKVRALIAIAATVLLTVAGAGLGSLVEADRLRFPGEDRLAAAQSPSYFGVLKQAGVIYPSGQKDSDLLDLSGSKRWSFLTHGTTYYGRNSADRADGTSNNIIFSPDGRQASSGYATIGLGTGTMAKYANDRTTVTFYDLDNKVRALTSPDYFKPGESFAQLSQKAPDKLGGQKPPSSPYINLLGSTEGDKNKPGGEANGKPPPDKKPALPPGRDQAEGKNQSKTPSPAPPTGGRKVIRSGEIEFEIDSFDAATAIITRLVAASKGGFIATVNSEKLANGKMRGSVVVRIPPDQLDAFVLGLRKELGKTGELKGQRIGSQDITKQYTDLESRLKAAHTMEQRLLAIIRDAKGQIKDLLQAEKELGVWRTRVEEMEGELRYYANQVALSTLSVVLTEKDIRTAAAITERERVQAGVEVEDVETAMRELLKAVAAAKGRVLRSEMKQYGAEQFNALMHFEVAPDQAGPVRDRLRQLGTVTRLEIDRVQQPENGGTLPRDGKVVRGDTQIFVSLYNLANVGPRETITLKLAAADVDAAYRKLREAVAKARGHTINAQLNEEDRLNVRAQLDFDVRRTEEGALQGVLAQLGEVLSRNVTRKEATVKEKDKENLTDAKLLFKVELLPTAAIPPRETVRLTVEVADVDATLAVLAAQVKEAGGTVIAPQIAQGPDGRVTAQVVYRVPLTAASGVVARVKAAGQVRVQKQDLDPRAPAGKLAMAHIVVTLSNAELLVPSEQGLWAQVRHGLSVSLRGLSLSASWLIVGLFFVLPWLLLVYAVVWLVRRLWRGSPSRTAVPASADTGATAS